MPKPSQRHIWDAAKLVNLMVLLQKDTNSKTLTCCFCPEFFSTVCKPHRCENTNTTEFMANSKKHTSCFFLCHRNIHRHREKTTKDDTYQQQTRVSLKVILFHSEDTWHEGQRSTPGERERVRGVYKTGLLVKNHGNCSPVIKLVVFWSVHWLKNKCGRCLSQSSCRHIQTINWSP